jgi:monofunctional biosynthetic peptidoglycan transglycosylase
MAKAKRQPERLGSKRWRLLIRWCLKILFFLFVFSVFQVTLFKWVNPPFTLHMAWRYVSCRLQSTPYQPPDYTWRSLQHLSPHLQKAVLAGEDQRFLKHAGFDGVEIRKALKDMLQKQKFRGASTISMQTVRTVFLLPSRSIWRKGLEAYYTALIELLWSKRRILEVYLNTVDWGPDLMGATAAARHFFRKPASRISPREAALLAAVLPNPHRFSPRRPDKFVRQRAQRILKAMPQMPIL